MPIETERKYLNVNLEDVKKRLLSLGASTSGRHFETNILLDTIDRRLYQKDELLRLRKQEWADKISCVLTFKNPLPDNDTQPFSISGQAIKRREETEYRVDDFAAALAVFAKLGFEPWARYEKIRESFALRINSGKYDSLTTGIVEVDLDLLNFIKVVEIEGDEALIDQAEKILGLDKFKKSSTNYHKLHQDWLMINSYPPTPDFVFEPCERAELRRKIGLRL